MMRKFVCLLVAVSTFIFGVGLYFLWYYFIPVPVSLCELARHPDWYNGRIVRVAAPARNFYERTIILDEGCNLEDSWAVVIEREGYLSNPEARAFLAPSETWIKKADMVVTGRFDKDATPGCYGPKFGIDATEVEVKQPVSFELFIRREE